MSRLTEIDEFGNADIIGMEDETWQMGLSFNDMNKVTLALNRLHRLEKLYEQHKQPDPITGLVPCGCNWCGPERIGWFSVQFWVRACYGKRKWMSVTQDWKKKVKYCPMCGRKLKEGANE